MPNIEMSWCQDCKRWVPTSQMQYFEGMRVCTWCVEGTVQPEGFVHEPYHESIQCIYCDSYNTVELASKWNHYKCKDCGETFMYGRF